MLRLPLRTKSAQQISTNIHPLWSNLIRKLIDRDLAKKSGKIRWALWVHSASVCMSGPERSGRFVLVGQTESANRGAHPAKEEVDARESICLDLWRTRVFFF